MYICHTYTYHDRLSSLFMNFFIMCPLWLLYTVVPPESVSVILGQEAEFVCAGVSIAIGWTINGTSVEDFGASSTDEVVDGVRRSTLTVSGSVENNNASIQCLLIVSASEILPLPPVFLTVLGKFRVVSL